ncbi:hypothetical protein V6667_07770 [Neisseria leonii]|uniref:hypothetical protein n=1 Tax=Neisseria leonii TaxID=2995413 RepID=UPI00237C2F27|nr:hypothetical protein [Neisseria sp. 3986]MDD9325004.1 hypothetical protein [Neisseria sp. 3986]
MMFRKPLLLLAAAAGLTACANNQTKLGTSGSQLSEIRYICIIDNPKAAQPELSSRIAQALQQNGIDSETVSLPAQRKRLYEKECRYNLRYSTAGNAQSLTQMSVLIRTPDHPVASLRYRPDPSDNVQQQIDNVIARLLMKQ